MRSSLTKLALLLAPVAAYAQVGNGGGVSRYPLTTGLVPAACGSTTQIQFNLAGACSSNSQLVFDSLSRLVVGPAPTVALGANTKVLSINWESTAAGAITANEFASEIRTDWVGTGDDDGERTNQILLAVVGAVPYNLTRSGVRGGVNTQEFNLFLQGTGTITLTQASFARAILRNGQTVTNLAQYVSQTPTGTTGLDGHIVNFFGFTDVTMVAAGAAVVPIVDITNRYGFYAGTAATGTNKWSFYAVTDKAYFGGQVNSPLLTPASSAATCTQGDREADASFIYICTATNTWKRAALSAF